MGKFSSVKKLLPYIKKEKLSVIFIVLFGVITVSCKIAVPFVVGLMIDKFKNAEFDVTGHLFLLIGLVLGGAISRYVFDTSVAILNQKVIKRLREELFSSYQDLPFSYLDSCGKGDLLKRLVADVENVQNGLILGGSILYEGVLQIIITIVMMCYVNWILGLVVICLTPLSIVVSRFISKSNSKYIKKQNEIEGQIASFSNETLLNIQTIDSYNLSSQKEEMFDEINKQNKKANFKAFFAMSWINPSTRLVNNIIYATVTLIGAFLCINSIKNGEFLGTTMTVGYLSIFLSYSYQYMTPFNDVSNVATEVVYSLSSLDRVIEIINKEKDNETGEKILDKEISTLEAKNISFAYPNSRQVIDDFSLEIYKGHKIAIVGPTGCGKTTIVNLIMRFYDPQNGQFEFNKLSSYEFTKSSLRSHIGLVLQDSFILHGSVRENICFGNNYSQEEIEEALRKARCDDFIRKLPQGLETIISNESGLSYGQKQLLCVARIILNKPELIILDEATSNIDLRTELLLAKSLDELMKGKTSIVIAHRLSTIKNADHIVVMNEGKIIQQGNFKQLLSQEGLFKEIYNSQFI